MDHSLEAQHSPGVVLLWSHPLVFDEVSRLLESCGHGLTSLRIEPDLAQRLRATRTPPGSTFIVEMDRDRERAEAAVDAVLAWDSGVRLLVLAESFDELSAVSFLSRGVKGLVTFQEARERLGQALDIVSSRGFWVSRALLTHFVETTLAAAPARKAPSTTPLLTRREKEIFDDLLSNLTNKEIAKRHNISDRTAKFHVSNLLSKHHVRRRADLLLLSFSDRQVS